MNKILIISVMFCFISISQSLSQTFEDLYYKNGLYYKKFTDVPFNGTTKGLEQIPFKDGKVDGFVKTYFKNGKLKSKTLYKNGRRNGLHVRYHENGLLLGQVIYKKGKLHGESVTYFNNGILESKGSYVNDNKSGRWIRYKKNGELWNKFSGLFENDVKISD